MAGGTLKGVQKGWKGQILDAKSKPVASGAFVCVKATAKECIGSVPLTRDQVVGYRGSDNKTTHVVLTPP